LPEVFYRAYGYHVCGPRAVRIDILERLADIIRPLLAWRPSAENATHPPRGATGEGAFTATPEMMSLLGCSPEELSGVLKALGFRVERRPTKKPASPSAPEAAVEDVSAAAAPTEDSAATSVADAAAPASVVDAPAPASEAAPESAPATVAEAETPEAPAQVKEPEFEEIWRPRRHTRAEPRKDGARARRQPNAAPKETQSAKAAPPPAGANGHGERPTGYVRRKDKGEGKDVRAGAKNQTNERGREQHQRRSKGFEKRPREDRRKPEVHSAAPPRKVGIEADSPFAALGALRDELAKRSKESSST